ncbi:flavodoxin domain-containing protein, partial [Candidatus Bipolaricaulota bacterium]|nr:flavodoxin domain-containing protein [Candidatus Bipolaricaulota bacterium]
CENTTATVARVSEEFDLADYDTVLIGSPIYRKDQILDSITDFVTGNKETLAGKKVGIFIVALDVAGSYLRGKPHGGLEHLKEFADLFAEPPIYGKMLGGEQVPTRLSSEDKEKLLGFYKQVLGADKIPYRYTMDKPKVWEYAERFHMFTTRSLKGPGKQN